jgi:hypothetical protein
MTDYIQAMRRWTERADVIHLRFVDLASRSKDPVLALVEWRSISAAITAAATLEDLERFSDEIERFGAWLANHLDGRANAKPRDH